LWIGIRDGESELRELQRVVAERVARAGVALEERPFSPHLTLGRWKESRSSDRSRLADAFHARAIAHARVDRATLFESRISSKGPTYTELARATLSG
jgi:2'-5' RNA ligase